MCIRISRSRGLTTLDRQDIKSAAGTWRLLKLCALITKGRNLIHCPLFRVYLRCWHTAVLGVRQDVNSNRELHFKRSKCVNRRYRLRCAINRKSKESWLPIRTTIGASAVVNDVVAVRSRWWSCEWRRRCTSISSSSLSSEKITHSHCSRLKLMSMDVFCHIVILYGAIGLRPLATEFSVELPILMMGWSWKSPMIGPMITFFCAVLFLPDEKFNISRTRH